MLEDALALRRQRLDDDESAPASEAGEGSGRPGPPSDLGETASSTCVDSPTCRRSAPPAWSAPSGLQRGNGRPCLQRAWAS